MTTVYAPPPGPPPTFEYALPPPSSPSLGTHDAPTFEPSCRDGTELGVYIRSNLAVLATHGWIRIPLPPEFEELYASLFRHSSEYFDLPSDSSSKTKFAAPTGRAASEEGFYDIPEEKQLITMRRISGMPPPLRDVAADAWNATGELFIHTVQNIADSLELEDRKIFDDMSSEANNFPETTRSSSLLRLFRYNRPVEGGKKIVAEAHKDLGILTLVIGESPGLDALDLVTGQWISVEDVPKGPRAPKLTATLLTGQTLTYLTRGLYSAGSHRVSVLPPSRPEDKYRFSIVFALRASPTSTIETARFEKSPLVGKFPPERLSIERGNYPNCSMYDQPAVELYRAIAQTHWNVNIAPDLRNEQKRKLEKLKEQGAEPPSNEGECP